MFGEDSGRDGGEGGGEGERPFNKFGVREGREGTPASSGVDDGDGEKRKEERGLLDYGMMRGKKISPALADENIILGAVFRLLRMRP